MMENKFFWLVSEFFYKEFFNEQELQSKSNCENFYGNLKF